MGYIVGQDRSQSMLFPPSLEESITAENPVRFIEAFVEGNYVELDTNLSNSGFYAPFASNSKQNLPQSWQKHAIVAVENPWCQIRHNQLFFLPPAHSQSTCAYRWCLSGSLPQLSIFCSL